RPDAPASEESGPTATASIESSDSSEISSDDAEDVLVSTAPDFDLNAAPNFRARASRLLRVLMQSPAQIPTPKPTPPVQIVPGATPTPAPTVVPVPGGTAVVAPVPTPSPTPAGTSEAGAGNIARPAGRWIQRTSAEFGRGKFDGTLVGSDNTLRVGPRNNRIVSSAEPVAWSVATDGKGTVYLGTGQNGRLLKVENGVSKVLYEGPEVAVTALALDKNGLLYAGVSPGGRVLKFNPDGTHQVVLETGQTFVHALVVDQNENLIVATGGESAKIYRLNVKIPLLSDLPRFNIFGGQKPRTAPQHLFATVPQKHARSLSISGDLIYVGTSNQAVLYRIDASGRVIALYQAAGAPGSDSESSGGSFGGGGGQTITISPGGGGAPQGGAVQIIGGPPQGGGEGGGSSGNEITAVAAAGDTVYFGTANSGSIFRWSAQNGVRELFKTPGRAVYALQLVDGALWAATGESGEVWRISDLEGDPSGARVLDATQPQVLALASAGGRVFAATGNNAAVYEVGGLGQNTFTSNVFDAGQIVRFGALRALGTGSIFEFRSGNTLEPDAAWSNWQTVQNGENVTTTPARYAQYRVNLADGGTVSRVEVAFRAPNRAPRVTWTLPAGSETLSGKKTLDWNGTDPDRDALRFKLELLGADGKIQPVELTTATASSQEIDTKKYADGIYTARVAGSDAARNPEDPQSDTSTSLPFTIDNTPPAAPAPTLVKEGEAWSARFAATDALSPLAGAEWRLAAGAAKDAKPGDWQAAASSDGLFDAKAENVVARLDPALSGVAFKSGDSIEFRVRDAAGNAATTKVVLS
ncbi:MAG TPA: hypothetical protein VF627_07530, partial [Abditibacterium sp.]